MVLIICTGHSPLCPPQTSCCALLQGSKAPPLQADLSVHDPPHHPRTSSLSHGPIVRHCTFLRLPGNLPRTSIAGFLLCPPPLKYLLTSESPAQRAWTKTSILSFLILKDTQLEPLRGTPGSSLRSPAEGEGHEGFPPPPDEDLESCLENPRDGGAWWAAVCEVAQSRTRLKRGLGPSPVRLG